MQQRTDVPDGGSLQTYFASPERATADQLRRQVEMVNSSPIMDALLEAFAGWVAVLNEHRQILAVNHAFLRQLGLDDPLTAMGLRPGEALHCVHADELPGGCGTSKACRSCGAAIAIVSALSSAERHECECVMSTAAGGPDADHDFLVRTLPFRVEDERVIVISMREVSEEKRRQALERAFLHDVANTLTVVCGATELLQVDPETQDADLLAEARESARMLRREVEIQRLLLQGNGSAVELSTENFTIAATLARLRSFFETHPAAEGKELLWEGTADETEFETDVPTLMRILVNLLVNALEASWPGDTVRITGRPEGEQVVFRVWNAQAIEESVQPRVFQRYFTTKDQPGRGMGAFSAKLLAESLLRGSLTFETSNVEGTTFFLALPRKLPRSGQ